jgi:hypothetical protein
VGRDIGTTRYILTFYPQRKKAFSHLLGVARQDCSSQAVHWPGLHQFEQLLIAKRTSRDSPTMQKCVVGERLGCWSGVRELEASAQPSASEADSTIVLMVLIGATDCIRSTWWWAQSEATAQKRRAQLCSRELELSHDTGRQLCWIPWMHKTPSKGDKCRLTKAWMDRERRTYL